MSHSAVCLNCENPASDKFCSNCGQKTDTHRINFKHFIFHDILHGVWHFEKGILFTIKEAFTRPGQAAADYIAGKRIKYYNVFYLNLLLIGFNIYFGHVLEQLDAKYNTAEKETASTIAKLKFDEFLSDYSKILIFCLIPLFAFIGLLLYKKAKYNLSEQLIISGIVVLGIMCITSVSQLFYLFDLTENFSFLSDFADSFTPILILIYIFYCYYDAFKKLYSRKQLIARTILLLFLFLIGLYIFLKILIVTFRELYNK
jgi:hypothetical protein